MTESSGTHRRAFLTGSLTLGAVAATAPALGQSSGSTAQTRVRATTPTAEQAHAEAGLVDVGTQAGAAPALIENPGSDFMVDLLRATRIKYIAATAGSTFRGLHESIVNYGGNTSPELIVCLHEEISAALAHGYAKVAGAPMACLVHSQVGLQHASMAIYNAWCDRAPMLVLAGNALDATKRRPGVEWLHSMSDLGALVRDYVKWDDTPVSLPHYAESYMRAFQLTMTPPYEPVLLVVDTDLQEDAVRDRAELVVPRPAPVSPPGGDPAAIAKVADLMVAAEHPVIVVDRVARTPAGVRLLVSLAELLNAPVIDRGGRMNMPSNHYLNQTGRSASLLRAADVILGLELTDIWGIINNVPDKIGRKSVRTANPAVKVIGISANYAVVHSNVQDVQRFFSTDLALAADAETCLPQLMDACRARITRARHQQLAARRPALEAAFNQTRAADAAAAANGWDASPVSTARLSMEIWERIRHLDWGLVSNTAFISSWPQRLWDITEHHHFIGGEGGYGVGYGAAAAVGAAIAHRDAGRIAVSITTDGDLMMLPGTLWTLAHHQIPLLMVMHNNRAWHQETMHLKRLANWRNRGPETWGIGTVLTEPNIDFATLARSMGVWSEGPVDQPAQLGGALDRALAVVRSGKPALVDVVTQPR